MFPSSDCICDFVNFMFDIFCCAVIVSDVDAKDFIRQLIIEPVEVCRRIISVC